MKIKEFLVGVVEKAKELIGNVTLKQYGLIAMVVGTLIVVVSTFALIKSHLLLVAFIVLGLVVAGVGYYLFRKE